MGIVVGEISITPKEMEILYLIAEGYNSNEIANELDNAEGTIKVAVKSMRRKLKAKNSAHLVAIAYHEGLLKARR